MGGSGHLLLCVIRVGGYLCDLLYNKCFFGNFRFAPPPGREVFGGKKWNLGTKKSENARWYQTDCYITLGWVGSDKCYIVLLGWVGRSKKCIFCVI